MRFPRPAGALTIVGLRGRLGNLLFQYAAALSVQQRIGGRLLLLDWRTPSKMHMEEIIDVVDLHGNDNLFRGPVHSPWRKTLRGRMWRVILHLRVRVRLAIHSRGTGVVVRGEPYDPLPGEIGGQVVRWVHIRNYCQHPSWYDPSIDLVTRRIWSKISPYASRFVPQEATVISIRGGDYRTLGWDLDLSYYERAIEALGKVTGPVWVSSDDPTACERLLPILASFGITADPLPETEMSDVARDFMLLAVARNVIMSNSTFCWWGTITGQLQGNQADKRIIAPARWLPPWPSTDVLLRPDWELIDVTFASEKNDSV